MSSRNIKTRSGLLHCVLVNSVVQGLAVCCIVGLCVSPSWAPLDFCTTAAASRHLRRLTASSVISISYLCGSRYVGERPRESDSCPDTAAHSITISSLPVYTAGTESGGLGKKRSAPLLGRHFTHSADAAFVCESGLQWKCAGRSAAPDSL